MTRRLYLAALASILVNLSTAEAAPLGFVGEGGTIACPEDTVLVESEDANGRSASCRTEDGTAHGPAAAWHPDGSRRSETHWVQGRKHGRDLTWDDAGVRREQAFWVDGLMHGTRASWYADGGQRSLTDYVKGKRDGRVAMWNEDGTQILEGFYKDGHKHGIWSFRGTHGRESNAAFAVIIDDEDLTQGLLEEPPSDCKGWKKEVPLRRRGYVAVMALLSLRVASQEDEVAHDEFPIALCIAEGSDLSMAHIDAACDGASGDFIEAARHETVKLAVDCGH